jgi:hypothetical protein
VDVSWRVDLLKRHLELVEQSESDAALLLHDLVDHLAVEVDFQVPQRLLYLREVVYLRSHVISINRGGYDMRVNTFLKTRGSWVAG